MVTEIQAQEVEKPTLSAAGSLDGKFSPDLDDGDEALQLLGVERTTHFSEEFNEKLKRKLVWNLLSYILPPQNIINTPAGPAHSTTVCRSLFYPISVGPSHYFSFNSTRIYAS